MQSASSEPQSSAACEARFAALYAEHGPDVLAYALRRVNHAEDAGEVLAETFLVAWRRLADVPCGAEARLWLYGVARRTLANHRRGEVRRVLLAERLRAELSTVASSWSVPGVERTTVISALKRLETMDREVLLLAGWEELEPAQIAKVLGISAVAARGRLHRARRRLRRQLGGHEVTPEISRVCEPRIEEAG